MGLASTDENRRARYKQFVESGIAAPELKLIRAAVRRNQLTGGKSFILEIERRIGKRILLRSRGRPCAREE